MNIDEFLKQLTDSYPKHLQPDPDFLAMLKKELKKSSVSSQVLEESLSIIAGSFRYFPAIMDVKWALDEARKEITKGTQSRFGFESFDIEGVSYSRPVEIDHCGEVQRKKLPYGALNYRLNLPYDFQAKEEYITAEQARAEGIISDELYRNFNKNTEKRTFKSRFQKIGEYLHGETNKQEEPKGLVPEDFIDDSMASNPEEPTTPSDPFGDI